MKGETIFFIHSFSLNVICLYLKQNKAWIHRRKVLNSNSSCSCLCIVPFHITSYNDMYPFFRSGSAGSYTNNHNRRVAADLSFPRSDDSGLNTSNRYSLLDIIGI